MSGFAPVVSVCFYDGLLSDCTVYAVFSDWFVGLRFNWILSIGLSGSVLGKGKDPSCYGSISE
ncbi:unnamed protein product, partial [Arabidopsis halleri]